MAEIIDKDVVAVVAFTLHGTDGEELERIDPTEPLAYLHGHGQLPEAFEAILAGLSIGATFDEEVPNAFGVATGADPQRVRKADLGLPRDQRADLAPGASFVAEDSDGKPHRLWITQVRGSSVWITTEHPMAGRTVRFAGTVHNIRDATASEIEHGHAHGRHGHQH